MINEGLIITTFLFVTSCYLTDYFRGKYPTYFSKPSFAVQKKNAILISMLNMGLTTLAFKLIYPFLENTFIHYEPTSFWPELIRLLLILFLSDTCFYWLHRFMHIRLIYKYTHKMHHRHLAPISWSAFYFHPFELILTFIFVFLLPLMFVRIHFFTFQIYVNFLILSLVKSHTGIKIYSYYSSEHHEIHHQIFNRNYGSDLGIWDKICGTEAKQ